MALTSELSINVAGDSAESKAWTMSFSPPAALASSATLRRQNYSPKEHWRILGNLLAMGFAFALLFTAFMATANLQSSVNTEGNLGVYSLATMYGAFLVSSLFLPPLLLAHLKTKGTLIASIAGYVTYIAAQFHPTFYTLIPASLFIGVSASGLWTSQSNYVTKISEEYAIVKGLSGEIVSQRFFGFFFLCFHSSQVWGNLISSLVLSSESTIIPTSFGHCGANSCPAEGPHELPVASALTTNTSEFNLSSTTEYLLLEKEGGKPSKHNLEILTGIFLGCSIVAALVIILGLDSLKRYGEDETRLHTRKWYSLLLATIQHWRNPKQALLIPLAAWVGIQEAFLGAEFTRTFVSCALGIHKIGFVMAAFGVSAAVASLVLGKATAYTGRTFVFSLAATLNATCFFIMLFWQPHPDQTWCFFLIAVLWGVADGIWSPQVRSLYGSTFVETREAAFSNAGLWLSIGFIIVYVNAALLCMTLKISIYLVFLALTLSTFLVVEFKFKSFKSNTKI